MRFVGRGHPAIRATHAKTLELSPDPEITARATCIVAVGTEADPLAPMAGRVRIRIAAGAERFTLEAEANPSWDPAGPAVVRRSSARLPGTFATDATASSADLPRALVDVLQDPDALVTVDVVALPDTRETIVLAYLDPAASTLPAWVLAARERADTVLLQDPGARALLVATSGNGLCTLVVATAGLPRNVRPDAAVDVLGLGAPLAAAAASPTSGPVVLTEAGTDLRDALRDAPATSRVVLTLPASELAAARARARDLRGSDACTVVAEHSRPERLADGVAPAQDGRGELAVCFDAAEPDDAIDAAVRAAIDALLADGVATRTAAKALAVLTGWDRRRAYDTIVDWRST